MEMTNYLETIMRAVNNKICENVAEFTGSFISLNAYSREMTSFK